jgi:hypothetical protein
MLNLRPQPTRIRLQNETGWGLIPSSASATAQKEARNEATMKHRACIIEEVTNGYVVRLYEPENRTVHNGHSEWFIERTLASVEKRIESYFLLSQFIE